MRAKAEPCAECGREPLVWRRWVPSELRGWYAECPKCRLPIDADTRAQVVRDWNRTRGGRDDSRTNA
jgi:hypothetical protein